MGATTQIPRGFILNLHLNFIPFKLTDDNRWDVISKYVHPFMHGDDPYAYAKMTAGRPTFIGKILATLDTDQWEKPEYHWEDLKYFRRGYLD